MALLRWVFWIWYDPLDGELPHRGADFLRLFPHSVLAYQLTPPRDLSSTPLVCSGTSSFPVFSVVPCCQQVPWDIALTQHPRECTRAHLGGTPFQQRPARLWRSQSPGDSARPPSMPPSTPSRTLQRPNVAVPLPSYSGRTRPRASKHRGSWPATRVRGWWLWGGCWGRGHSSAGKLMFNLNWTWLSDWNRKKNASVYD